MNKESIKGWLDASEYMDKAITAIQEVTNPAIDIPKDADISYPQSVLLADALQELLDQWRFLSNKISEVNEIIKDVVDNLDSRRL
jgi:hypothetical protein